MRLVTALAFRRGREETGSNSLDITVGGYILNIIIVIKSHSELIIIFVKVIITMIINIVTL